MISGFLITMSFQQSRSIIEYIAKRVLRICPGFFVAYLICVIVVAPMAGVSLDQIDTKTATRLLTNLVLLRAPDVPGVFSGMHYATLNGSMWTIEYEFRCYLIIAALGALGVLKARGIMLGLTATAIVLFIMRPFSHGIDPKIVLIAFGSTADNIRFISAFLVGSIFFLYRDCINTNWLCIVTALVIMTPLLFIDRLAEPALLVFGGYALLATATKPTKSRLATTTTCHDLSYGVYLYAWPIQMLLVQSFPPFDPTILSVVTWGLALIVSFSSWTIVERPFLILKARLKPLQCCTSSAGSGAPSEAGPVRPVEVLPGKKRGVPAR